MELTGTENAVYEGADVPLDEADEGTRPFEGDGALDQAVEALERKRETESRQRPRLPEPEDEDANLTTVRYQDGRAENTPITLREAQRDYAQYKATLAQSIMEGVQADFDAAQAAEAEAHSPEAVEAAQTESREKQWNDYVEGLSPEGRAQLTAAVEYQNKAQAADQTALVYETALVDLVGRLTGSGTWNDIQTVEQAERLRTTDPARFQQLQAHVATVQNVQAEALRVNQQRQAQQQAQFQEGYRAYAEQQDRAAEQLIPELAATADPESQRRLMRGTIENLREVGFSDRELQAAWVQGAPLYLRDARAQKIIADAARWRMANSREARNDLRSKRINPPPPQRPGASVGDHASFQTERALSERLQKTNSIHDAVKLLQARRASRR